MTENDSPIRDPFEIEALAARYRAERDLAIQERERLEKEVGLLRGAEHERDMLRDLADVLVVKVIEHPTGRTFVEGLDDAEIDDRIDSIIEAIDRRLMPEGYEWPRFEDGELLKYGDAYIGNDDEEHEAWHIEFDSDGDALVLQSECYDSLKRILDVFFKGERVKRPAVLAADGEPLEVGQTVWEVDTKFATPITVVDVDRDLIRCEYTWTDGKVRRPCLPPDQLTHHRPVLDADGVPIKKGDTVWHIETGREYVVVEPSYGETVVVRLAKYDDAEGEQYAPDQLTHGKPEPPDTWERIEEDVMVNAKDYCESRGIRTEYPKHFGKAKCEDLVRRCRVLAEHERGE